MILRVSSLSVVPPGGLPPMWGPWIGCRVPAAARGRFSADRSAWSVIGDQPGLAGQVGGWDPATGRAHALGLWAGADAHGTFMRERHDAVVAGNRQGDGFTAIGTAAGEVVHETAGDMAGLAGALQSAALLRVADRLLLPGREEHVLEVQRRVRAPGTAAGGMPAGAVTRSLQQARRVVPAA
ncbi:DUF4937 domain-containing protein [Streptomyces roseifaciens]